MADIKVFISSVQREFAQERRQLCDYIRTDSLLGRFFVPFIFEDMPASEVSAQKAYLTQAAECHIYLGILGTGTTDIISDCEDAGLRTPEFIEADDFRTIIYRKVSDISEKVIEPGEKVTEQYEKVIEHAPKSNRVDSKSNGAEQKSNQVRLTAKQRKVLEFCEQVPHTAQEILEMVGVKYQTKTVEQYTTKLVEAGLLRPTTVHRNDSNRRYITAHNE